MLGPPQCQLPGCLHNLGMAKLALLSRAVGVKTVGCPKITADTNADKDLLTQKCLFSPLMIVKSVQSARLQMTGTDGFGGVCESSHLMTADFA